MDTVLVNRGLYAGVSSDNVIETQPILAALPDDFEARKLALHYAVQMGGTDPLSWTEQFLMFLTDKKADKQVKK